jgi:hypothetical protein
MLIVTTDLSQRTGRHDRIGKELHGCPDRGEAGIWCVLIVHTN